VPRSSSAPLVIIIIIIIIRATESRILLCVGARIQGAPSPLLQVQCLRLFLVPRSHNMLLLFAESYIFHRPSFILFLFFFIRTVERLRAKRPF